MSDLARFCRRLPALLALAGVAAACTAGVAQADNYGEIGHFGSLGRGSGQIEPGTETSQSGIGVDTSDNNVYVVDNPNPQKDEYRIQRFAPNEKGEYKPTASVTFKPKDPEAKEEEPDDVSNIAVDPATQMIYLLASEVRPSRTEIDVGDVAASELYAFSTAEGKLTPATGTTEEGVLAGTKVLKPTGKKAGESLLFPNGIAVDPTTHEVVILGYTEPGHEELTTLQRVSDTGTIGQRWVDSAEDYLEGEATSPVVTKTGKVLVSNFGEIDQIPGSFKENKAPVPFIQTEPLLNYLNEIPGGPLAESGGALSVDEEGRIYSRAGIVEQLEGKKTGFRYPGVERFSATGAVEGWTGGQSAATVGENGPCKISFDTAPQVAAGKGEDVFVYDSSPTNPRVIEFGPGGSGCAHGSVTVPSASVNGVPLTSESEQVPISKHVTFSSTLTESNALSVEWEFGDGTTKTVSTNEYETTEVEHQFVKAGELTVTEKIHTDDLAQPELVTHRKIRILEAHPTAVTEAPKGSEVGTKTATLKGTVNPHGEVVTKCQFEYGTTTTYGSTAPCNLTPEQIKGLTPVAVSANVTSLAEHMTYHFRLIAESAEGKGEGADETFTTGPKPAVLTGTATGTTQTTTVLNATVDPSGANVTECRFEYGTTTSYGSSEPCSSLPGNGTTAVPVSASISGLTANTTYHYRVYATTVSGTEYGSDATLTTAEVPHATCETAECLGGTGKGGVLPTHEEQPPPPVISPAVQASGTSATVSSTGAFTLTLKCPAGATACTGTITVKTIKAVVASASKKPKAVILTLASGSFALAGGQSKVITLHLSSTARKLLASSHLIAARASIVAHNAAGLAASTTATLSLRPAKKVVKKH